jgi:membrane-bound lytic murein transglycosylase B
MLAGREARYGTFEGHAKISQALKAAMHQAPRWASLADDQKEALEMVQHKVARILNGDPNYADNWIDIAGYATLVANRLEKEDNAA